MKQYSKNNQLSRALRNRKKKTENILALKRNTKQKNKFNKEITNRRQFSNKQEIKCDEAIRNRNSNTKIKLKKSFIKRNKVITKQKIKF